MAIRHFLTLRDLSPTELNQVIHMAIEMKAAKREGRQDPIFAGKVLGMIFEKSSTARPNPKCAMSRITSASYR